MIAKHSNLLSIVMVLLFISLVRGQQVFERMNTDSVGNEIEIKLVTIGPGDDLTSWWGHTAVIVEDRRFNISLFYNYGLFSFEQENFVYNFLMGRLIFWVGAWNTSNALAHYLSLNREIRIQILDLNPSKKVEMAAFLANNVLPQNREYLYDHYNDNCATRVRDLIDKIVDGQFYRKFQAPGKMTFRQHTRRHTDKHFLIDWLLMFLMNDSIDQEIRQWDDMFLPEELEYYVSNFTYNDSNGQTHNLVKSSYTYYNAKNRTPVPQIASQHWRKGLLIGMISALILFLLGFAYSRKMKFSRQIFALFQTGLGILYGLPGLILFFMSVFTDHTVTYHNENLFLANPFTTLLIPLGIGLFLNKQFAVTWLARLWYLLGALNIMLLILKLLPVFDQYNRLSISLLIPLTVSACLIWYKIQKAE